MADVLPLLSLKNLLKICARYPSSADEIRSHLQDRFHGLLDPYVTGVDDFAAFMQDHHVLISGSTVFKFIDPAFVDEWRIPPSDLDLYAPLSRHRELVNYLLLREGYVIVNEAPPLPPNDVTRQTMMSYCAGNDEIVRITRMTKDGRSIDVVCSKSESPLLPILRFHSTAVMNALSPDYVFVAYREMTFARHSQLNPSNAVTNEARTKWISRGFSLVQNAGQWQIQHNCRSDSSCPHTVRVTNDRGSLLWSFTQKSTPCSCLSAAWRLGGAACLQGCDDSAALGIQVNGLFRGCAPDHLQLHAAH